MKKLLSLWIVFVLALPLVSANHNPAGAQNTDPLLQPFKPLIIDHAACAMLSIQHPFSATDSALVPNVPTGSSSYKCTVAGEWEKISEDSVITSSMRPYVWDGTGTPAAPTGTTRTNCCTVDSCWDGAACVQNEARITAYEIGTTTYDDTVNLPETNIIKGLIGVQIPRYNWRCIDGTWKDIIPKTTWTNDQLGFCNETIAIPGQPEDYAATSRQDVRRCLVTPVVGAQDSPRADNLDEPDLWYSSGNGEGPSCIRSDQFIMDHLCDEVGNWTSRTKVLALQMLRLATSDAFDNIKPTGLTTTPYSLACDNVGALFSADQLQNLVTAGFGSVDQGVFVPSQCQRNGLYVPCFNNVCVLTVRGVDKTPSGPRAGKPVSLSFVGTSLNVPIEGLANAIGGNTAPSFLKAINPSFRPEACSGIQINDGNSFRECRVSGVPSASAPGVYFMKNLSLVLYSPDLTQGQAQGKFVIAPGIERAFIDAKTQIIEEPIDDDTSRVYAFFKQRNNYDTLYAAEKGSKKFFGYIETDVAASPGTENQETELQTFIGVQYTGGTFDVCKFLTQNLQGETKSIQCAQPGPAGQPATRVVIRTGDESTDVTLDLLQVWRDLTVKLRP